MYPLAKYIFLDVFSTFINVSFWGPPKSRGQDRIKSSRGLLWETLEDSEEKEREQSSHAFRSQCSLTMEKMRRKKRIVYENSLGKADGESPEQSSPSEKTCSEEELSISILPIVFSCWLGTV